MGRPYYSKIARAWQEATGAEDGAFKKYVLNDLLLESIGSIGGMSLLEIGAGNGYFARLLLRRKSGQVPSRLVITDISGALLRIAQNTFRVPIAEYRQMDLRRQFPFETGSFDLVLATMVFNELRDRDLRSALQECSRVLSKQGRLLATVLHPDFVSRLEKNGQLRELSPGFMTMPGKGSMRLPVIPRTAETYERSFEAAGFGWVSDPVYPDAKVLSKRPGLRHARGLPLAAVYTCTKQQSCTR